MGNQPSLFSFKSSGQQLNDIFNVVDSTNSSVEDTHDTAPSPKAPEPQPVHVVEEHCPRFEADDPQMGVYLREHGFAVVKNVANSTEVSEAMRLLWNYLQEACEMKESDMNTWTDSNMSRVGCTRNGIMNERMVQHSDFMWYIRLLPLVKRAFSSFYKTSDLITSFDGGNIFRPWHLPIPDTEFCKTHQGWFHVDQGRKLRGFQCVQGFVTLTDANAHTGGFCLIPGSHHSHERLMNVAGQGGHNFVIVPSEFPELQQKQILPVCKAGDLVLWDSRTIHCNCPAFKDPFQTVNDPPTLLRAVGYVCLVPRNLASRDTLINKMRMYERGIGTSHWPHILGFTIPEDSSCPVVNRVENLGDNKKSLIVGNNSQEFM